VVQVEKRGAGRNVQVPNVAYELFGSFSPHPNISFPLPQISKIPKILFNHLSEAYITFPRLFSKIEFR